jgi:hypothetical protein
MSCHKDVCGECATEWDGINYCVTCLAARRRGERGGGALLSGLAALLAGALLFVVSAELMVWAGALLGGFL